MKPRLRALFCDHLSIMRGKYLPEGKIGDDSTRFCRSVFGTHYDKDLLDAPGAMVKQGLPDMELRWRHDDIRDSWHQDTKIVLGDLYDDAGHPLPLCPRGALKRAVADWQALGLTPKVGIELEAYAMQGDEAGRLQPYDAPGGVVYGTGPFADPLRFNDRIWAMADEMGFALDMITAEFDSPQFEYTLTFDDAVKAVDDIVLFRLMAREIALEYGIVLTFMPKPVPEGGGSGMHVNFSFVDETGGNAVSSGARGGPEHMNDLARGCLAGLLHHHKGLAGLIAPTSNSYMRLQPGSLSGYWQNWGGDHRNVTTRISSEGGAKARLEHRMADASSNPYTTVAAVLQASRLGVQNGYALPPMETGDGFDRTDAREGTAIDLKGAVADLEADAVLAEAVGAELVANHVYMKRKEVRKTRDLEGEALRDFYVHFI
ncbi:glutamine synthetase family protein [Phaeobacter italicus]|jgi:glutamine synthetase|uniref:Glutamine synthetase n=2 Tax=Phaeobacter italicus TaxID=481446 RepID=A0A0H5DKU4_9RHOB|nr:glutamine synthetase family protein [Phaeobacter italicus]EEB69711.1 glutamate--ammonia ligase [Ruegeria sp. R11]NKX71500.1 glutamine synthetase [Rhodobacteraceae bacterium R_SAG1]MBO9442213.1 glutamine synthetase [Phaeobacter italicus]MBY5976052.1 glutamine synthetase family protein [Phaeobacter italicus]MCI5100097.1 glutamine synthetase family protein [Phaeobacter italicus]